MKLALVDMHCHYRCIGATNKALAKRRAAENGLSLIAEKEASDAAAAETAAVEAAVAEAAATEIAAAETAAVEAAAAETAAPETAHAVSDAAADSHPPSGHASSTDEAVDMQADPSIPQLPQHAANIPASSIDTAQEQHASEQPDQMDVLPEPLADQRPNDSTSSPIAANALATLPVGLPMDSATDSATVAPPRHADHATSATDVPQLMDAMHDYSSEAAPAIPFVSGLSQSVARAHTHSVPQQAGINPTGHTCAPAADQLPAFVTAAALALNDTQPSTSPAVVDSNGAVAMETAQQAPSSKAQRDEGIASGVAQHSAQPVLGAACTEQSQHDQQDSAVVAAPEAQGSYHVDEMGIDDFAY